MKWRTPIKAPNYGPLFDFIETPEGQAILEKIESGKINFSAIMNKLKNRSVLPRDSSKRVWHSLCMLYTKRNPPSVRMYEL